MPSVSPADLLAVLRLGQGELAVLDVREAGRFAEGHVLLASSLPAARVEADAPRLVPRRATPIVLIDDNDGLAARVGALLRTLGYTDIAALDGGMPAWRAAGFEVFTGLNAPSKALGAFAQAALAIPEIGPDDLAARLRDEKALTVIDCRPNAEYRRGCVPGAVNIPGVALLRHAGALAASGAPLVVTCAGRTRGLLGTQTLIDAGLAGRVTALRDGTMGWELTGRTLEKGATRAVGIEAPGEASAAAAARMRDTAGIAMIDRETLTAWQADTARTTFLFDVREAEEYARGHLPGARHVVGGQLVQNLDQHVATRGARLVLADDDGVRATAAALWLKRMGWDAAVVAAGTDGLEAGAEQSKAVPLPSGIDFIDADELAGLLESPAAVLVDLAPSRAYFAGHIPGAYFATRSRLPDVLARLPAARTLVLTSEDGRLAAFTARDPLGTKARIRVLKGGTAAWTGAGRALSDARDRLADTTDDVVWKPSELTEGREAAMRAYLSGSDELPAKVARDGTLRLNALPLTRA